MGINFLSPEIYRIKRRDTMPQALSIVTLLVILMMFAFSMQLMSIAPTYVTFGDQKDNKSAAHACSLQDTKHFNVDDVIKVSIGCRMTMISELYTKMELSVPLFSLDHFILSWMFVACFAFFTGYHAVYKNYCQAANLPGYSPLGESDGEDEDLQILMHGRSNPDMHQRTHRDKMAEKSSWQSSTALSLPTISN